MNGFLIKESELNAIIENSIRKNIEKYGINEGLFDRFRKNSQKTKNEPVNNLGPKPLPELANLKD